MAIRLIEPGATPSHKREILIEKDEFLIGRGIDCDLHLNVPEVSRHHCLLRGKDQEYTLSDLGSANGTFLNGQRVRSQIAIKNGDELRIGNFRFLVDLDNREGIVWGNEEESSPMDTTQRFADLRKELEHERMEKEAREKKRAEQADR